MLFNAHYSQSSSQRKECNKGRRRNTSIEDSTMLFKFSTTETQIKQNRKTNLRGENEGKLEGKRKYVNRAVLIEQGEEGSKLCEGKKP